MASQPGGVRHISKSSIKPPEECVLDEESKQLTFHLSPWDLTFLSTKAIQQGLLFPKPAALTTTIIIDHLKDSLSPTLSHFYPLAGHLVTHKQDDPPSYSISCENTNTQAGGGVDFVHAVAENVTMADILSPPNDGDLHPIVESFFLLNKAINHDGHTLPLLAVQVTELLDGIFIACSINHAVCDGISFWNFFNTWAEICRNNMFLRNHHHQHDLLDDHINNIIISRPPVLTRRFLDDGHGPIINLPFSHHDEFIDRYIPPVVFRNRFFHFSSQSIARLRAKVNAECSTTTISSFQALSALVWRSVTRARHSTHHLPSHHQKTSCILAVNDRSRLNPPLSPDYFGCCTQFVSATATVGELLNHGIGWAALLLYEIVNGHTDSKVREWLELWMKTPSIPHLSNLFDRPIVAMTSSHKFDMYGCDFGWGKAEAVRSGLVDRFDGKVISYPGHQGGGSVDLELSLLPESMSALESDPEFMDAVSSPFQHHHHQM